MPFRWEPVSTIPGVSTTATVASLTEGEEYEFRIIAVNKGGLSEPSDPSATVVAKTQKCKKFL